MLESYKPPYLDTLQNDRVCLFLSGLDVGACIFSENVLIMTFCI